MTKAGKLLKRIKEQRLYEQQALDPVSSSEDSVLRFVFQIPSVDEETEFQFNFIDGSSPTRTLGPDDKSTGKFAFVGKKNARIFQTWDSQPSENQALEVLQRVKAPKPPPGG